MPWPDGTPKIELHRHLGGCFTVDLVHKLYDSKYSHADIASAMVCKDADSCFKTFLSRFKILDEITWTEEKLALSLDAIYSTFTAENLDYVELSISLDKYLRSGLTPRQACYIIATVTKKFSNRNAMQIKPLLSMKMESDRDRQRSMAKLIEHTLVSNSFYGIDFVGDEDKFDSAFYKSLIADWHWAGKDVVCHAGEIGPAENIVAAIEHMRVKRIRHGVNATDYVVDMAKDHNVCFDVSLHSNLRTGAVKRLDDHPIRRFLARGVPVALGADDPSVLSCTLDSEFDLAKRSGLVSCEDIENMKRNAMAYAIDWAHR